MGLKYLKQRNSTLNSRVYRLYSNMAQLGCSRCHPHRGCNRKWFTEGNWKTYRKTQYYRGDTI